MIRVIRIAGESYDLETGEELPKALILSNGLREFALHVDDDTAHAVVQMMAESQEARSQKTVEKAKRVSIPGNGSNPVELIRPAHRDGLEGIVQGAHSPAMATVVDAPEEEELMDDEGYEPGEEYSDPATGVGSL